MDVDGDALAAELNETARHSPTSDLRQSDRKSLLKLTTTLALNLAKNLVFLRLTHATSRPLSFGRKHYFFRSGRTT